MKRNIDKHTSVEDAKNNILKGLMRGHSTKKSGLGYLAFPDYTFKWSQGAAFSVAKIVRGMQQDGLLTLDWSDHTYQLTAKALKLINAPIA